MKSYSCLFALPASLAICAACGVGSTSSSSSVKQMISDYEDTVVAECAVRTLQYDLVTTPENGGTRITAQPVPDRAYRWSAIAPEGEMPRRVAGPAIVVRAYFGRTLDKNGVPKTGWTAGATEVVSENPNSPFHGDLSRFRFYPPRGATWGEMKSEIPGAEVSIDSDEMHMLLGKIERRSADSGYISRDSVNLQGALEGNYFGGVRSAVNIPAGGPSMASGALRLGHSGADVAHVFRYEPRRNERERALVREEREKAMELRHAPWLGGHTEIFRRLVEGRPIAAGEGVFDYRLEYPAGVGVIQLDRYIDSEENWVIDSIEVSERDRIDPSLEGGRFKLPLKWMGRAWMDCTGYHKVAENQSGEVEVVDYE